MNRKLTILSLLTLFVVVTLVTISALSPLANASNSGPKAAGQGTLIRDGEKRTFAFNAIEQPDGTVKGHVQLIRRDTGVRLHLEVKCLSVVGNRATLGGVVTSSNDDELAPEGQMRKFTVEDNGEGKNNPPDRITTSRILLSNEILDCNTPIEDSFLRPIENGNIQVKP